MLLQGELQLGRGRRGGRGEGGGGSPGRGRALAPAAGRQACPRRHAGRRRHAPSGRRAGPCRHAPAGRQAGGRGPKAGRRRLARGDGAHAGPDDAAAQDRGPADSADARPGAGARDQVQIQDNSLGVLMILHDGFAAFLNQISSNVRRGLLFWV